jgi:tetratricopeptide (TPR) repeat protein
MTNFDASFDAQLAELAQLYETGKYPRVLMQARLMLNAKLGSTQRAHVQWWLGRAFITAGEFEQGLRHALAARMVFAAEHNDLMQARAEMACVRAFWRLGETEQALVMGNSVVAFARSLQDMALMSEAMRILGLVYCDVQQFLDAHEHVGKALTFAESVGDNILIAECVNSVGSVLFEEAMHMPQGADRAKRLDMAETRFRRSLALAEAENHEPSLSTGLGNVGAVLIDRGLFAEAYEITRRANAITLSGAVRTNAAYDLVNMAECEHGMGQPALAIETMQKGLAQAERMGMKLVQRYVHGKLGEWYGLAGESLLSDEHSNKSHHIANELKRDNQERKNRIEAMVRDVSGTVVVAHLQRELQ